MYEPTQRFHLVPDVRRSTPNGHQVTWGVQGTLKEFNRRVSDETIAHINTVYAARLPHVEWGIVIAKSRSIPITRIGIPLQTAVREGLTTIERAIADIEAGARELHGQGLAHCDIHIKNIFVDNDGTASLDDLEYLAPKRSQETCNIGRARFVQTVDTQKRFILCCLV
jgi:hypothetical protein